MTTTTRIEEAKNERIAPDDHATTTSGPVREEARQVVASVLSRHLAESKSEHLMAAGYREMAAEDLSVATSFSSVAVSALPSE